jgi:SAM-dependent methyltransferase
MQTDSKPQRSLLIGCGHSRAKQIQYGGVTEWSGALTTMDVSPICGADIVFDMEEVATGRQSLPFADDTFDEVAAFNTQEHWGKQGDFRGWFWEMGEIHRIMKPGGLFFSLVPIGQDALADPGHTRFFQANHWNFLSQAFYDLNAVKQTCFSDYRWIWQKNFDILYLQEHGGHHLAVVLRKA